MTARQSLTTMLFAAVAASCSTSSPPPDADATGGSASVEAPSSSGGKTVEAGPGGGEGGTGGSTGPQMCQSLTDGVNPSPTPGACDGNHAVTCSADGFIETELCGSGFECKTYTLEEWRFDGSAGEEVKGRTVTWAGCLPVGAETCEMQFDGHQSLSVDPPECAGPDRIRCGLPPVPNLHGGSPQLQYTTTAGVRYVEPCPNGERCAGSDQLNVLTCIDEATPSCTGAEPFCQGDGSVGCHGTWESSPGYQKLTPCDGTDTCYEGTNGPICRPPGAQPCVVAAFENTCTPDGSEILTCNQGYTQNLSCATCFDPSTNSTVPCRCDELTTVTGFESCQSNVSPVCIPATAVDCVPGVDPDVCTGTVARRCRGAWQEIDCAAQGKECAVNEGIAGCRDPNAPSCSYFDTSTCDGTEVVSCCGCSGESTFLWPPVPSCVPGFEIRSDCADLGPSYECNYWVQCEDTGTP